MTSVPGTPGGPGSFGPVPGTAGIGARSGAWVGAFLSAVALGRFSIVIGRPTYTGPLMPPSFRILQKWTIIRIAVMSGKRITWAT